MVSYVFVECLTWYLTSRGWIVTMNCILFFFFLLFRAAGAAFGGSQARGQIRATAAGLHHSHSNARSELCPLPTPSAHGNAGSLTH